MSRGLKSTLWIEKYLKQKLSQEVSLDEERYLEVRNFVFLWNVYEREFLENKCSVGKVWSNYGVFEPEQSVLNEYYAFLVKKYSSEVLFKRLKLAWDEGTYESDVKSIISKTSPSSNEKMKVCMLIIWRYRNNLFHGGKEISYIWKQGIIFREANKFLVSGLSKKTGVSIQQY